MQYRHDPLLDRHLEKQGGLMGALGRQGLQFGKGAIGFGGKGIAGTAGTIAGIAAPVAGAMGLMRSGPQTPPPPPPKLALYRYIQKLADGFSPGHRALSAASYAAFALPYLSKTVHNNQGLSTALNVAGLAGLGGQAAHGLMHGDKPAAYDLAGLGLMGAGMLHQHLQDRPTV
jgi:hypothetical protein